MLTLPWYFSHLSHCVAGHYLKFAPPPRGSRTGSNFLQFLRDMSIWGWVIYCRQSQLLYLGCKEWPRRWASLMTISWQLQSSRWVCAKGRDPLPITNPIRKHRGDEDGGGLIIASSNYHQRPCKKKTVSIKVGNCTMKKQTEFPPLGFITWAGLELDW